MNIARRMKNGELRMKSTSRAKHITQAVAEIMIRGCVLEFGVGEGNSLNWISNTTSRKIFAFDSFEGLPEDWQPTPHYIFAKGSFKYDPPEKIRDNVELVVGWFEDTIPVWKETNISPVAFIHIDSDLYSSCVTILTELNDQIVPGTILLFDELIDYDNWEAGEWKALQEWLQKYDREIYEIETYRTQVTYRVTK